MTLTHPMGILATSQAAIEAVHPEFLRAGLIRARQRTIETLTEIKASLKEGMTEDDARRLALSVFADQGVSKHWHKPYIRFGAGTSLTFNDPLQQDYRLKTGDPYYLDLGPVWRDLELGLEYEGDYGDTFIFGENPETARCAETARELFTQAQEKWRLSRRSGEELYAFLKTATTERGYTLVEAVEGHRLGDFPHHKYSKEQLASTRFIPSDPLWVLEVMIQDPAKRFGAFYEDLLLSNASGPG